MPLLISGMNHADAPEATIEADGGLPGLDVQALLTPRLGEVWRTQGKVEALVTTSLPHDTDAGAGLGSDSVRQGVEPGFDGTAGRAVQYRNNSAADAFVRLASAYQVQQGRKYRIVMNVHRRAGDTTAGNLIHVVLPDNSLAVLPLAALPQGNTWQVQTLEFTAPTSGAAKIYAAVNTGPFEFTLDLTTISLLPVFTAGTRTTTLDVDLGGLRWVRTVALFAPRDGLRPEVGATVDLSLSAIAKGGDELGKAGDLLVVDAAGRVMTDMAGADFIVRAGSLLAMPRGLWCWVLYEPVQLRYLRIRINSAQPYVQFSRLWVGPALLPAMSAAPDGYQPGAVDDATSAPRRVARFSVQGLSEAEAQTLETIALEAGTQRQVFVVPRTERADYTGLFGRFTTIPMPAARNAWDARGQLYSADIAAQEDR